ncbi:MAG: ATP-grasp domain-containing protein [Methanobrevibacter sp.]|uniref:ATP-grasp domain-containing protein n=1 Tax=Methanobrevibacter sp. TaxID=66852 RepID=UPI0026E09954|nr:ATP-grasp domain-containing protein [Methanobrevibacter sp.]MDO5848904.1 ATP-grasp domain-containing protein [Methanobrevibacter sp.]
MIIGINTRSLVNSALKLDYNVFSTSYFQTADFPNIENSRCILNECEDQSCGVFEELYSPESILDASREYLEVADKIVLQSGVCSTDFKGEFKQYRKKILGNLNIGNIEDKFKFYNKIKNKYLTPETFYVNDIDEVIEINKNNESKQYILKPLSGSGGYNINLLNNDSLNQINTEESRWIMQEYISGTNVSSSTLGNGTESRHLINSRLLTANDFGQKDNFLYIGNILPLTKEMLPNAEELNDEMKDISERLIKEFKLIGSNGIDFIANENGLYVIELNPRIQGTYECCEKVLNTNMLYAHIQACEGNLIDVPQINGYSYKKIIYANETNKFKPLPFENIYDLPHDGSITEKGEPLLTIIEKNRNLEKLIEDVTSTTLKIEHLEETD